MVRAFLWSEALATTCAVACCSSMRSDCAEASCLKASSCFPRFSRSFVQCVEVLFEASGCQWILNRVLRCWLRLFALHAASSSCHSLTASLGPPEAEC